MQNVYDLHFFMKKKKIDRKILENINNSNYKIINS